MPINAHPEYIEAEKKFQQAQTDQEKILALEEMMKTMPKHKSGESLRKNIRTRYKKLKEKLQKIKQTKKSSGKKQQSIKKADMQSAIIGLTNSGKSSLLKILTNANPEIAPYDFTTKYPQIGTLFYENVKVQLIDLPAVENELCNTGLVNSADLLLIIIENIEQLKKIFPFLENASKNRIIIFNKSDLLTKEQLRKIDATLKSKKYNYALFSCKNQKQEEIDKLKEKIWKSFNKIRVYTKQPGKPLENKEPIILNQGSTVKDVAEKILHGLSKDIKETRITGPSSKFTNQKTSLFHVLKDKDIVEFYLK